MSILKSTIFPEPDLVPEKSSRKIYSADDLLELGIITEELQCRQNMYLNIFSILIPFIGTVFAVLSIPWIEFTNITLVIFLFFLALNTIGMELGLHRYFVHRSFKANALFQLVLGVLGTWSFQGPISRWVSDHRRHHRFSDQPYDAHSPYWIDDKPTGGVKGLFWAHFLWMLKGHVSDERRYAPDIIENPITSFLSRYYWWFATSGILLPAIVGYIFGGFQEAIRCFLWAGFARVALLHQLTWSVNSIGHYFGEILPSSKDKSRNNLILAVLTLGAGLHGYHHKYPAAAINRPRIWDPIGGLVIGLEKIGLIWNVRKYPE